MIFNSASSDEIVIDPRQHSFPVSIAIKYSTPMALWLQNLAFWTESNLSLNKNIHDGLCWSYTTLEALGDKFPYMTKSQRETMVNNSIKEGLVLKGNYNKSKYDRTVWYALTPKAYAYFAHLLDEKYLQRLYSSISENSEMDFLNFRNLFPKIRKPIPDTKPDTKPYINNIGASDESLPDEDEDEKNFSSEGQMDANNQTLEENELNESLNDCGLCLKSDYKKNQTLNCASSPKLAQYDIKNILLDNPFQIPDQMIHDWIANRKKRRAPVTQTAWSKINKELAKCKEQGIDPVEAFETMVASSWQSLKVDYFDAAKKPKINNMDTSWGDEVFKPFHEIDLMGI